MSLRNFRFAKETESEDRQRKLPSLQASTHFHQLAWNWLKNWECFYSAESTFEDRFHLATTLNNIWHFKIQTLAYRKHHFQRRSGPRKIQTGPVDLDFVLRVDSRNFPKRPISLHGQEETCKFSSMLCLLHRNSTALGMKRFWSSICL